MVKTKSFALLFMSLLLFSFPAMAQNSFVSAEDVKTWMIGKKQVMLIDARPAEEYLEAHIPGAINIMPDNMKKEAARLPKNKKSPIIFYCRGLG